MRLGPGPPTAGRTTIRIRVEGKNDGNKTRFGVQTGGAQGVSLSLPGGNLKSLKALNPKPSEFHRTPSSFWNNSSSAKTNGDSRSRSAIREPCIADMTTEARWRYESLSAPAAITLSTAVGAVAEVRDQKASAAVAGVSLPKMEDTASAACVVIKTARTILLKEAEAAPDLATVADAASCASARITSSSPLLVCMPIGG